jgi:hypothetical protein
VLCLLRRVFFWKRAWTELAALLDLQENSGPGILIFWLGWPGAFILCYFIFIFWVLGFCGERERERFFPASWAFTFCSSFHLGFRSLVGMQCPFSGAGEPTFGLDSWRTFRNPEGDCEMNLEGRGMEALMAISSS